MCVYVFSATWIAPNANCAFFTPPPSLSLSQRTRHEMHLLTLHVIVNTFFFCRTERREMVNRGVNVTCHTEFTCALYPHTINLRQIYTLRLFFLISVISSFLSVSEAVAVAGEARIFAYQAGLLP
ncbi:hypothetical protein, unlikely [Trypanosoma brucei gambiense DAL972]|uniref:Uncharacterized protein n=1 Tax=Trypanosoma brucei gambiense (strain MHOM/CI/86/DAL972) TaxID=679716 RepID=D0AAD0_TRYB9|nr:hypothetical protein, unlikely [Trypanosoma brucei gambiense DAL972]CBH18631.1 hypothetical protein, unlikely [Trypanosoma brucei gambiense DAL972]|eukprot:XP_011780895.1 hypothetical protein, unlikely [Trypanosoma brucei gambiense DAL972]